MNYFFLTEEEKEKQKNTEEYGKILSESIKFGKITLLEYTYLNDYYNDKGTIVNSSWFIEIINKLNNKDMCALIEKIFPDLYKKSEDVKIKSKVTKLAELIIKDKKDHIKFTKDQLEAISQLFDFLPDFNKKAYGLYGYAGTGKTTTIVEVLTFLLKHKFIKSVVFTAPTNKAVNVIKSKFRSYLTELHNSYFGKDPPKDLSFDEIVDRLYDTGIKIDFITIHKLLKFEMDFGADGELVFVKSGGESLIGQYEIIIIDECSMIPIKLVEHIFAELRSKIQKKCNNYKKIPKVIFLGDPAQLPPVNEDLSIIFLNDHNKFKLNDYIKASAENTDTNDAFFDAARDDIFKNKHKLLTDDILNMPTITLKKVMRSKLDTVTKVCYQFRRWAIGEVIMPKLGDLIKNGVFAYQYDPSKIKTESEWFKTCLRYYKTGHNCNIILTWTNKQADAYNQKLRQLLFKKDKVNRFEIGDILMLSDFYNMDDGKADYLDDNTGEKKFYTSEQIKIVKIEECVKRTIDFNVNLNKKAMKLQNSKHYGDHYKKTIELINKLTTRSYMCWKLLVHRLTDAEFEEDKKENYTIYVIHENEYGKWIKEKDFISDNIKRLRKTLISKFREKTATIETNIIKPLWREWHKNMIEPYANVNYGYAITCHKGQGSNFYNVFVDIDDILKNGKKEEAKKCLYTAATRASNELHLFTKS